MYTKQDYIAYWVDTAANDWKAVKQLLAGKSYIQALFWAHLVLEKLLKAHWVKDNTGNHPPKIHNLLILISKTALSLDEKDMFVLGRMNDFQLEGRYPEYITNIYKLYKLKETTLILNEADRIRKCLLKKLQ